MKRTLVRYKTRPDRADENERLIKRVFEELRAKAPAGIRYMSLRLDDGTFVHFAVNEGDGTNPLSEIEAFKAFQADIKERCLEPPQARDATIVGQYHMLAE